MAVIDSAPQQCNSKANQGALVAAGIAPATCSQMKRKMWGACARPTEGPCGTCARVPRLKASSLQRRCFPGVFAGHCSRGDQARCAYMTC